MLTCGVTVSTPDVHGLQAPVFPVASRTTWHGAGTSAGVLNDSAPTLRLHASAVVGAVP